MKNSKLAIIYRSFSVNKKNSIRSLVAIFFIIFAMIFLYSSKEHSNYINNVYNNNVFFQYEIPYVNEKDIDTISNIKYVSECTSVFYTKPSSQIEATGFDIAPINICFEYKADMVAFGNSMIAGRFPKNENEIIVSDSYVYTLHAIEELSSQIDIDYSEMIGKTIQCDVNSNSELEIVGVYQDYYCQWNTIMNKDCYNKVKEYMDKPTYGMYINIKFPLLFTDNFEEKMEELYNSCKIETDINSDEVYKYGASFDNKLIRKFTDNIEFLAGIILIIVFAIISCKYFMYDNKYLLLTFKRDKVTVGIIRAAVTIKVCLWKSIAIIMGGTVGIAIAYLLFRPETVTMEEIGNWVSFLVKLLIIWWIVVLIYIVIVTNKYKRLSPCEYQHVLNKINNKKRNKEQTGIIKSNIFAITNYVLKRISGNYLIILFIMICLLADCIIICENISNMKWKSYSRYEDEYVVMEKKLSLKYAKEIQIIFYSNERASQDQISDILDYCEDSNIRCDVVLYSMDLSVQKYIEGEEKQVNEENLEQGYDTTEYQDNYLISVGFSENAIKTLYEDKNIEYSELKDDEVILLLSDSDMKSGLYNKDEWNNIKITQSQLIESTDIERENEKFELSEKKYKVKHIISNSYYDNYGENSCLIFNENVAENIFTSCFGENYLTSIYISKDITEAEWLKLKDVVNTGSAKYDEMNHDLLFYSFIDIKGEYVPSQIITNIVYILCLSIVSVAILLIYVCVTSLEGKEDIIMGIIGKRADISITKYALINSLEVFIVNTFTTICSIAGCLIIYNIKKYFMLENYYEEISVYPVSTTWIITLVLAIIGISLGKFAQIMKQGEEK